MSCILMRTLHGMTMEYFPGPPAAEPEDKYSHLHWRVYPLDALISALPSNLDDDESQHSANGGRYCMEGWLPMRFTVVVGWGWERVEEGAQG